MSDINPNLEKQILCVISSLRLLNPIPDIGNLSNCKNLESKRDHGRQEKEIEKTIAVSQGFELGNGKSRRCFN